MYILDKQTNRPFTIIKVLGWVLIIISILTIITALIPDDDYPISREEIIFGVIVYLIILIIGIVILLQIKSIENNVIKELINLKKVEQ